MEAGDRQLDLLEVGEKAAVFLLRFPFPDGGFDLVADVVTEAGSFSTEFANAWHLRSEKSRGEKMPEERWAGKREACEFESWKEFFEFSLSLWNPSFFFLAMPNSPDIDAFLSRPGKVLLTGGGGFLGSHLAERLLSAGKEVLVIDDFSIGSRENLASAEGNPLLEIWEGDACETPFPEGEVLAIIHFAAPASPILYQKRQVGTLDVCSIATRRLLEFTEKKGARFFLASTSEVYGDPAIHPQPESYNGCVSSIGPRSCYDEGKRFAEALTMAFRRERGVETRIARFFNTYGPRMALHDGRVLPAFLSQALRGEKLSVFGDGSQTRSFCFVDDLIEGILRLLASDFAEPVNLGNPTEITIREFAEEILRLTGARSALEFHELPVDDPKRRRPDISRAKEILGWEPQISLREGLAKSLPYFKKVVKER